MFAMNGTGRRRPYGVPVVVPADWYMTYLLQFCGFSDPLQLFYLEQGSGAADP